jgi:hypothetical protein
VKPILFKKAKVMGNVASLAVVRAGFVEGVTMPYKKRYCSKRIMVSARCI